MPKAAVPNHAKTRVPSNEIHNDVRTYPIALSGRPMRTTSQKAGQLNRGNTLNGRQKWRRQRLVTDAAASCKQAP